MDENCLNRIVPWMGSASEKESRVTQGVQVSAEEKELYENIQTLSDRVIQNWNEGNELLRVLIAGPSQAGKTTLINKMFGKEVGKVGNDLSPTTKTLQIYDLPEKRLRLIDTRGFERGGGTTFLSGIEKPHLIWLVLNIQDSTQDSDFDILKHFHDVPALVILNKSTAVRMGTEKDTVDFDLKKKKSYLITTRRAKN